MDPRIRQMGLRRQTPRDSTRRVTSTCRATYNIPSLKMTTLDPEPFGKPSLLLGPSLLSDTNDTTTFTSNGLLDTGLLGRSSDGGEEGNAPSARSPSLAVSLDGIGFANDEESFAFTTNGLLDGPTQMTSTCICSDNLYTVFVAHLRVHVIRSDVFDTSKCSWEPLFRFRNPGWIYLHPNVWLAVRWWLRWPFYPGNDVRR